MSKVKPLLSENPTAEDLRGVAQIIDYLLPELKKRGRDKEANELKIKRDLYNLAADIMAEARIQKLRDAEKVKEA